MKSLLSERRTTHSALLLPQTQLQLCESSQLDPSLGCQDPDVQPRFTTPLASYASSRPRIARRLPRRGERVGDPATPLTDTIAVKPSLNQTPSGQCWPLAWIPNFARGSIDFDASGPICRRPLQLPWGTPYRRGPSTRSVPIRRRATQTQKYGALRIAKALLSVGPTSVLQKLDEADEAKKLVGSDDGANQA